MKRIFLYLCLGFLAACASGTAVPATDDVTAGTAAEPTALNTAVPATASPAPATAAPAAVVDNFTPATDLAGAKDVRQRDWTRGTADPVVLIIEYGDFQ